MPYGMPVKKDEKNLKHHRPTALNVFRHPFVLFGKYSISVRPWLTGFRGVQR